MKKILLLLLLCPCLSYAQSTRDSLKFLKDTLELARLPLDTNGIITYKIIDAVPGVNKDELYHRAKIWTALAFNSAKNVTQLDDKDDGNIIIKAITEQSASYRILGTDYPYAYYLHFSIHFTVKDNKYRMVMSNFSVETKGDLQYPSVTYTLERGYLDLKQWNANTKDGNMTFNKQEGLGSKRAVKPRFETINNLNQFALSTLNEGKAALSKPAKSDDF